MQKKHPFLIATTILLILTLGLAAPLLSNTSDHYSTAALMHDVSISSADSLTCCYSLAFQTDPTQEITAIETVILTSGVYFSGIDYNLASGWTYNNIVEQEHLQWTFTSGNIPINEPDWFSFCLGGWTAEEDIQIEIRWISNGEIVEEDILTVNCIQCANLETEEVLCEPDGSFTYTFDFVNYSGFTVDQLQIREPAGQDLVVEEMIILPSSLPDGQTMAGIEIHFTAAANQVDELCFEITPRHFNDDNILLECCTSTFCVEIPVCDECCEDFSDFVDDVNQGFLWMDNCPQNSLDLEAVQLTECDVVEYAISGIGTITVIGNEAITVTGLMHDSIYEICMTVTRQGMNNEPCFDPESLVTCIQFLYECEPCVIEDNIDWDIDCPPVYDPVCACDGMTYLNACAAPNWAGVLEWTSGLCGEPQVDEITLTGLINGNFDVELDWVTGGAVDYRYFLVQRKIQDGPWLTISFPPVDNATFDFLDQLPLLPNSAYRILGITWPGKVVVSNLWFTGIVIGTSNPNIIAGGNVWPNPTSAHFWVELPWQKPSLVKVFSSNGQFIEEQRHDGKSPLFWNATHLQAGLYQIISISPQGYIWRKKLIIIR